MVSNEQLYAAMAKEANEIHKQVLTICTAFLGGTSVFLDKLYISEAKWTLVILFLGWAALTYPLVALAIVRWKNVESHRYIFNFFKIGNEGELEKAASISKSGRVLTVSALASMTAGLILISVFTALNFWLRPAGG